MSALRYGTTDSPLTVLSLVSPGNIENMEDVTRRDMEETLRASKAKIGEIFG